MAKYKAFSEGIKTGSRTLSRASVMAEGSRSSRKLALLNLFKKEGLQTHGADTATCERLANILLQQGWSAPDIQQAFRDIGIRASVA